MEERWYCPDCGKVSRGVGRRYDHGDVELGGATVTHLCMYCGSDKVEAMEPCPTCPGWKLKKDHICEKCQLHTKNELARFLRDHPKPAREYLDDLLDGTSVEEFV